jgi:Arc/MetJ family transcription regulator
LIGDAALRGRLSANAMKVAELNHDSQAVRSKFQDALRRSATRISQ